MIGVAGLKLDDASTIYLLKAKYNSPLRLGIQMSTYRLDRLLSPRSLAVVGASPHESSVGRHVIANILSGGFAGPIHVVNPHHAEIEGLATLKSMEAIADAPDVAIIAVPPAAVPEAVAKAGRRGIAAAVIITAGLGHGPGSLAAATEDAARTTGLRLIGPNCLGVLVPSARLNASFATRMPQKGDLAVISQSGAIVAGMIEWAAQRAIGFSAVVSVGDQIDVDFGDLLDQFATDRATRAIVLYIESVKDARKFMSAARAAARAKPVIVIKAGRHAQGAKAAATHTGALAGSDAVYDAAFRRAGLLRVFDLDELFDATETLGRLKPFPGQRLAILTNGGGVGVLAVDRLIDLGGVLAELSTETKGRLDSVLPPTWSKSNPVDIIGDAGAARYAAALDALLADSQNDAVLVLNVPTALASSTTTAQAVAEGVRKHRATVLRPKPVLAVWIGASADAASRFAAADVPRYDTEADAVRGFMHLVRHTQVQDALRETPPSLPEHFVPDVAVARQAIERTLHEGRRWLDPIAVNQVLTAYAIPAVPAMLAQNATQAGAAAKPFFAAGHPVVVKILSPDIVHKSDVGGVRLGLSSEAAVEAAAEDIIAHARVAKPEARITGVIVQPMIIRPKAHELIVGIADDPTFGPVIVFGQGGTAVEVVDDKALALPPLDLKMASDLIARTRVARLMNGYRKVPATRVTDVALTLVKLAQLAADLPEVREFDINPLLADENGVLALDARIAVEPRSRPKFKGAGYGRFAVRPYPIEWEQRLVLQDSTPILVRPLRPEDEPLLHRFLEKVTAEDLRLRFFAPIKEFSHAFLARLTQLDYARAMAFAALAAATGEMLGAIRLHADANYEKAEYAILIRSDLKGRGLGWKLMELMIRYARSEGLRQIEGQVLRENTTMLQMCHELGFQIADDPGDRTVKVVSLKLQ
jgi:acetyltransferase